MSRYDDGFYSDDCHMEDEMELSNDSTSVDIDFDEDETEELDFSH